MAESTIIIHTFVSESFIHRSARDCAKVFEGSDGASCLLSDTTNCTGGGRRALHGKSETITTLDPHRKECCLTPTECTRTQRPFLRAVSPSVLVSILLLLPCWPWCIYTPKI